MGIIIIIISDRTWSRQIGCRRNYMGPKQTQSFYELYRRVNIVKKMLKKKTHFCSNVRLKYKITKLDKNDSKL